MRTMGKHGQGTISRRKDGRYQVRVTMAGGRRVTTYARSPEEAERERQRLVEARELDVDPTRQTVADFLHSWLGSLREAHHRRLRPRTLDHYELIVRLHIIPTLGRHRLDRLAEHHVQAWLDSATVSPRTVHHHRAVLRRALNVALRRRLIPVNPAAGVELPAADYQAKPLSLEEARKLLEATAEARLGPLWRLALDTGFRLSELLGLGWDDVDLEAGTVTLHSQLQREFEPRDGEGRRDGRWVRRPLKAARRLERLALMPETVDALVTHKRAMAAERKPSWVYWGLLFPTPRGQPYQSSVVLREFRAACGLAGIEERRIHDLRHTTASLMDELGVAEHVRQNRLGHATNAMARRYAKAAASLDRQAAETFAAALRAG